MNPPSNPGAPERVREPRSPVDAVRAVQRLLDPLFVRFECDHLLREPLDHVRAESLKVESCQRFKWGLVERLVATKPLQ